MRSSATRPSYQNPPTEDFNPPIATLLTKSLRRPGSDEVDELNTYFQERTSRQKEYIDSWFELQASTFSTYENYKTELSEQRRKAEANNLKFLNNIETSSLLRRDFLLDIESELKGPEYEQLATNDWFQQFKRHQSQQFIKLLHEIAKTVIASRFTKIQQEQRKSLEESIERQIAAIDKCKIGRTGDKINPNFKHYLGELVFNITELQRLDNTIPKILRDLQSRPKEYIKEIVPVIRGFADGIAKVYKEFESNTFRDAGNRLQYTNIDREEANRIRVSKYGFNIANRDLATLKMGRLMHPLIINFFLHFLKEKTQQRNAKLGETERVYVNENIIDVYRGESLLLAELGKEGGNMLNYFKRLGFMIGVDDKHFIFVEVRRTEDDLRKELIIYNSDIEKYQMFHNKIYAIFRTCLGLEESEKLATSLGFRTTGKDGQEAFNVSSKLNRTQPRSGISHVLDLRVANCPQQVNPFDSGVYACKNASLLSFNKKIMQGIYSQTDINQFRYEIFNLLCKIANDHDMDLLDIDV